MSSIIITRLEQHYTKIQSTSENSKRVPVVLQPKIKEVYDKNFKVKETTIVHECFSHSNNSSIGQIEFIINVVKKTFQVMLKENSNGGIENIDKGNRGNIYSSEQTSKIIKDFRFFQEQLDDEEIIFDDNNLINLTFLTKVLGKIKRVQLCKDETLHIYC